MKRLARAVGGGVALFACLAIAQANANTITYGPLAFPGGTGPFNNALTFDKFDTALGTLTGVEISMNAAGFAQVNVYNFNSGPAGFHNANASVPVVVVGPAGVTISTTLFAGPVAGTAPVGLSFYPGVSANYSASGNVPNANWGDYSWNGVGSGTFNLNAYVSGGSAGGTADSGDSPLFYSSTETVNGTVTVEYTYTSVPDGGLTAMLLGVGMLALGYARRLIA